MSDRSDLLRILSSQALGVNAEKFDEIAMDFGCYETFFYFDKDGKLLHVEFSYDDASIAGCDCGCN